MQVTNKEQEQVSHAFKDSKDQTVSPVPVAKVDESDDDPDVIFSKAVAEIDTQPLPKRNGIVRWQDVFQTIFCISLMGVSIFGIVWQVLTYPHTLVILYAVEKPARITVPLDIPTRTLAPVTVTRSQTAPTTGHGHQDARPATGILTFYNGNFSPQSQHIGTVFTGSDGVKIATSEAVMVPAAQPPQFAITHVSAYAMSAGSKSNIAAGDINLALSSDLLVKNLAPFAGGRDVRDFQAVAQTDVDILTATLKTALMQQVPQAFTLRPGETVTPTQCTFTSTADHVIGEEATTVTVKASDTCKGIAYSQDKLARQATVAFTQTRPAAHYHVIGSVRTTLYNVSPLSVTISGTWVYSFSTEYEQDLAQHIQGETPTQARKYLLKTGVVSQASVPGTLPASMYIEFVVLGE